MDGWMDGMDLFSGAAKKHKTKEQTFESCSRTQPWYLGNAGYISLFHTKGSLPWPVGENDGASCCFWCVIQSSITTPEISTPSRRIGNILVAYTNSFTPTFPLSLKCPLKQLEKLLIFFLINQNQCLKKTRTKKRVFLLKTHLVKLLAPKRIKVNKVSFIYIIYININKVTS